MAKSALSSSTGTPRNDGCDRSTSKDVIREEGVETECVEAAIDISMVQPLHPDSAGWPLRAVRPAGRPSAPAPRRTTRRTRSPPTSTGFPPGQRPRAGDRAAQAGRRGSPASGRECDARPAGRREQEHRGDEPDSRSSHHPGLPEIASPPAHGQRGRAENGTTRTSHSAWPRDRKYRRVSSLASSRSWWRAVAPYTPLIATAPNPTTAQITCNVTSVAYAASDLAAPRSIHAIMPEPGKPQHSDRMSRMLLRPECLLPSTRARGAAVGLALALACALAAAGCSHGSNREADVSTTSTPTPSTSVAPTTVRTTPPTTAWAPSAPQSSPDAAAALLVDAWAGANRPLAGTVASPSAVETLFAVPYPGQGLAISRGCSAAFPPIVCTYGPPGGASSADPIFEVYLGQVAGGWYATSVTVLS